MISWDQALKIIDSRELALLVRSPEQIATYRAAKQRFETEYGGTADFVISQRLRWTGDAIRASGAPFLEDEHDVKVLVNDFSYDFAPGIRHLVVWTKNPIQCGPDEFPTPEATAAIEQFIQRKFVGEFGVPRKDIAWFKNTVALQSIPSVSHFHVLVRNGDAVAEKVSAESSVESAV